MGNIISGYIWRESEEANDTVVDNDSTTQDTGFFRLARKRKPSPTRTLNKEAGQSSPKVIKLDTAKYLHQKLFVEGKKSDVTIVIREHEWHLHKIYLEQCDYFRCLFSGNWRDSSENRFEIPICDDRVTFEGLDTVFASLYQNEIRFELKDLSGILSASVLFNLQVCIERCEEQMLQSIDGDSVIEFLDLSKRYGCIRSRDQCIDYLARFYWKLSQNDEFLQKLSYDLMILIYSLPQLCVVEGEKDMYNAVKRWIFIQREGKLGRLSAEVSQYFASKPPYHFYEYKELLKQIRYQHMITSKRTLECLKMEHIIGEEILSKIINNQWEDLLVNEEKELLEDTLSDEYFYTHCRRLGRALSEDKCWRWAGLDFGLDLLFRCQGRSISMTRNLSRDTVPQSLSLRKEYKIHFRLLVLNNIGDIVKDTGRKMINLGVDQKHPIAFYPPNMDAYSIHLFYVHYVPSLSAQECWNDTKRDIKNEINMIIDMACNKKEDLLLMKPILALQNSKPYNCIQVQEKNKREAIQDNGDFKFLMDYLRKVLKWHQRVISMPEVARYAVPYLELPKYISTYYEVTEMSDRNYALREAQKSLRLQYLGVKPVKKTKSYFEAKDVEFKYETNVTNYRQNLSKKMKKVTSDNEVEGIEDNQFLLYYRVMKIWETIQDQAEKKGDVNFIGGSNDLFPIKKFSQLLVDTPPLPITAKYDQLVKDIAMFKNILKQRGEHDQIERDDADNIVTPSNKPKLFGYPRKWQPLGRIVNDS